MEHDSGLEATVAAPPSNNPKDTGTAEAPLPEVSAANYQLDRELARGGMGKIVAAQDRRLHRRVALKQLLEPSGDHVTRFQREALITARLQHPGIVPVYEAGRWPTGEPFFAMKLVSGRPLDKVIGEATRLEERLAIIPRLAAACDAIAYAHSQRIIHRDLKPGNVLVGDFGETVVIDWGLAKDLDAADTHESANRSPKQAVRKKDEHMSNSATLTVAGAVMGTPAYMAPEQARGEPLDQRADVFSLGAMLYHTLCGVPPYNARTATDVIAAAALGKIVPLRERERRAPPDLVAIVERAMAPSPYDRYPEAGELADELRRFLTGQLVDAHRYTASQRLGRFVKKHRAAVTIAAIALTGFIGGGTIAVRNIVEARDRARREEQIAVTRKQAAEHLIDYMFDEMKNRLSAAGRLDLLSNIGQEVKAYYAVLQRAPGGMSREDEIRMAQAIDLIGASSRVSGKPDEALETWKQAREHLIAVVGNDKTEASRRLRFMIAQFDFQEGRVFQERGKSAEAQVHLQRAEAGFDELTTELKKQNKSDKELLLAAAETHDHLGDLLRIDGKIDEAFEQYNEAKNEREAATSTGNGRSSVELLALSTSHFKLGSVFANRGESGSALEEYRLALRQRQTLLEAASDDVERQLAVLEVERELADVQRSTGDEHAAIETYKEAIPLAESLVRRDPTNTEWQYQRGNLISDLGYTLSNTGAYKDALVQLGFAIEVQKDLVARDSKSSRYKIALSRSHTRVGDAQLALGKIGDGVVAYRLALEIRSDLVDADAKNVAYRRSVAWSYAKLSTAFAAQGNNTQALEAQEQALALRKQLVAESPAQGGFKNELALSEAHLGRMVATSDPKRAATLIKSSLDRAHILVNGDSINMEFKDTLVIGLLASATLAKASGDEAARAAALDEALAVATEAANTAKQNANWPGHLAEIHQGLADHATATGDARTAKAEWKAVRDVLEPLAAADHLAAARRTLLERARGK
jgi:serine/threonine protein kinase